jgi:hypothetical protein
VDYFEQKKILRIKTIIVLSAFLISAGGAIFSGIDVIATGDYKTTFVVALFCMSVGVVPTQYFLLRDLNELQKKEAGSFAND